MTLEATLEWYCSNLGFEVERWFAIGRRDLAFIALGELRIELIGAASAPSISMATDIGSSHTSERLHQLCRAVEDLDSTLNNLAERGARPLGEPMSVMSRSA